jgi:hypothetical protein
MHARAKPIRWSRCAPFLLIGVVHCDACEDPWPPPPPDVGVVRYLSVAPNALYVYVKDATREDRANLVAFVHGEYGRNIDDHTAKFAVSAGDAWLSLLPLGTRPDSMTLVIAPACASTDAACAPAARDGIVTVTHPGSGLTLEIPVHVRYERAGDHGVAATPANSTWPMFGMATGTVASVWQGWNVHAFVRRTGFMKFDPGDVSIPLSDEPAGVVLSRAYVGWREGMPWRDPPVDVEVPATSGTLPAALTIRAFCADDPARCAANEVPFLIALEGAADIVSYTPVGARVNVDPTGLSQVSPHDWEIDCAALGNWFSSLPAGSRPESTVLTIYLLALPTGPMPAQRAAHCGPGTLAATGDLSKSHVIVVPQGSPTAATIAHEIGHALALEHVTMGSGFFDDNLMVLTDDISAPMRNRLTLGQAFRAALHPSSFIVTSGKAKSGAIECLLPTKRCPSVAEDAVRRTP